MKMKKIISSFALASLLISCKSSQETKQATQNAEARTAQPNGERPNPEEMFAKMDTNSDGKLAKEEIQGKLKERFEEIDSNNDGYISKEELKNAPKPQRQGGNQRKTPRR